jgi:hypothetical protein
MNTLPLGVRLNNPCNVERTNVQWQGMTPVQTDPKFLSFISPSWGFRCAARVFHEYVNKDGCSTITEIINRWAPSVENNVSAYISDVCSYMGGIDPDAPFDFPSQIEGLLKAVTHHEQGMMPYEESVIQLGITLEKST